MGIKIGQSTWIQVTNNSAFYLQLHILKHRGSIEESSLTDGRTLKVTPRPASASAAGKNYKIIVLLPNKTQMDHPVMPLRLLDEYDHVGDRQAAQHYGHDVGAVVAEPLVHRGA